MKIGIFDSGFGGLAIFKKIHERLPEYNYLYLADSARAPYGNYSHQLIYQYVVEAVDYLFKQDCYLVILACNTASAQALRRVQQEWLPEHYPDRRVLGVIRPIAEAVVGMGLQANFKIGVIGTRATIEAGVYTIEIENQLKKKVDIIEQACPLLVPLIEEGFAKRPEMKKILRYYLRPLKKKRIEVLINGCTHYELLHDLIQATMGKQVKILNSPQIVADSLADYLKRHPEIEEKLDNHVARERRDKKKTVEFLTTDDSARFNNLASKFWDEPVKAKKVEL